ncbi:MAG: hypothetical protein ACI3XI_06250 [Eubacteriales bacterium]
MSVVLFLGGILFIIIGLIAQVAAIAWIGFAAGLIGFIWLVIEGTMKNQEDAKKLKNN